MRSALAPFSPAEKSHHSVYRNNDRIFLRSTIPFWEPVEN